MAITDELGRRTAIKLLRQAAKPYGLHVRSQLARAYSDHIKAFEKLGVIDARCGYYELTNNGREWLLALSAE